MSGGARCGPALRTGLRYFRTFSWFSESSAK
jgi:hypothetical protein